jgi:hypothetical protein
MLLLFVGTLAALSATTNTAGTVVTVTFTEAMSDPTGKHAQFALSDGTPRTFSAAALNVDPRKIDLTISGANVANGATLTLAYTQGTVTSVSAQALLSFAGFAVTNATEVDGTATAAFALRASAEAAIAVATAEAILALTGTAEAVIRD